MNILRRLRAQRAARRANKKKGLAQKEPDRLPIFRSGSADNNAIEACETFGLSSTKSSNSSQSVGTFAFSNEDILRIHKTHTQDLEERDNEIRKMQMVMQEFRDLHRDAIEEKDNAIFQLQNELSCAKQQISNQEYVYAEIESIKSTLTMKQLELNARKQDVLDMNHHLRIVQSELKQTQQVLQESLAKMEEQREQIEDRDAEISKLQKKLKLGRAASSAVFGLMTLGAALSTDDSRAAF
jgi:chromosome segregation ATPase